MWQNAISAALRRLLPFAFRGDGPNCRQTSAGDCHTAGTMRPMPSQDARQRLARAALVQREILAAQWQAARKRRDMQAMHRLESELRASVASILIREGYSNEARGGN